ncbi:hypothetical protein D3C85_1459200 [compost metagenome]
MFKNLSFFKRVAVELIVSPWIFDILKGKSKTNFFLPLVLLFFTKDAYAFLLSCETKTTEGTFKIIPSSTPLAKVGFPFISSSWLKPNIFDKLYKVSFGLTIYSTRSAEAGTFVALSIEISFLGSAATTVLSTFGALPLIINL